MMVRKVRRSSAPMVRAASMTSRSMDSRPSEIITMGNVTRKTLWPRMMFSIWPT